MSKGYIYIASNEVIKGELLKIGLTKSEPIERVNSLSRCTSIPNDFILEYEKSVSDVSAAEIRVHMLLEKFRYRKEKEFFTVNLHSAIQLIDWIGDYLEKYEYYSEYVGLHQEWEGERYDRRLTLNEDRLVDSTVAFSIGQSIYHHIYGYDYGVVSGFASAESLAKLFGNKTRSVMPCMKRFCEACADLKFIHKDHGEIKIYDRLLYHKGHMAWSFNNAFRPYISNNKI